MLGDWDTEALRKQFPEEARPLVATSGSCGVLNLRNACGVLEVPIHSLHQTPPHPEEAGPPFQSLPVEKAQTTWSFHLHSLSGFWGELTYVLDFP